MPKCRSSTLIAVLGGLFVSGCYQGEWRLGTEVPVSMTSRLHTVRSVETWELSEPGSGTVVKLKATSTQRCRLAMYGKSSRTDTGTFERLGGNWWKGAAIVTGIAGGAGVGIGLGGMITQLEPKYGGPITYATGGAIAAGGIASCLASISNGSKVRYAFCGILTGFGASILAGGALSTIPGSSTGTTGTGTGSGSSSSASSSASLVDLQTFQTILTAGGGLVGVSILTGIIGQAWQGNEDRIRTVDTPSATIWDDQQSESACNAPSPLQARGATLNITVENVPSGPGSDEKPLKVRVQPVGPGPQMVDLRWIRQALPSCGILTAKVVPDVVYPPYADDYAPTVGPDLIGKSVRPIFTQVLPPDGVSIEPLVSPLKTPPPPNKNVLHGISPETLKQIDRVCSGEAPVAARPKLPTIPIVPALPKPEVPSDPVNVVTASKPPVAVEEPGLTPGLQLGLPIDGEQVEAECSRQAQQARLQDCELQCGRNLQLSSCLAEYRPCVAVAKTATQPLRERALCEVTWNDCLDRKSVSSSSFRSCTEACADANTPSLCRERKPRRLAP